MSRQVQWNFDDSDNVREYISASPQKELNFFRQGDKYVCRLQIANTSRKPVFFKVRTTAAKFYVVHPTAGRFLPREQRTITVHLSSKEGVKMRHNDRFLIQAFPDIIQDYDEPVHSVKEALEIFQKNENYSQMFQNLKMKVHFEIEDEQNTKEEQKPQSLYSNPSTPKKSLNNFYEEAPFHIKTASTSTESLKRGDDMVSSRTFENLFDGPKFGQIENKRKEVQDRFPASQNRSNIDFVKEEEQTIRIQNNNKTLRKTEGIYKGLERGNIQDFQFTTPKNLINGKDSISGLSGSEESLGGNDSISSSKRGLVLKHKLLQLSDQYRKQKVLLDTVISEKVQYTEELNKLKFIYSKELAEPDVHAQTKVASKTFEGWQLLLISVCFLIIGSLVFS